MEDSRSYLNWFPIICFCPCLVVYFYLTCYLQIISCLINLLLVASFLWLSNLGLASLGPLAQDLLQVCNEGIYWWGYCHLKAQHRENLLPCSLPWLLIDFKYFLDENSIISCRVGHSVEQLTKWPSGLSQQGHERGESKTEAIPSL